jgi:hypothetical protein
MQCVQQDALEEHNLFKFHTCKVWHALAWKHPLALHFLGTFIGNDVVCLLLNCSDAGLVDEGMHYYGAMNPIYTIFVGLEHCTFMVDLLGYVGHL